MEGQEKSTSTRAGVDLKSRWCPRRPPLEIDKHAAGSYGPRCEAPLGRGWSGRRRASDARTGASREWPELGFPEGTRGGGEELDSGDAEEIGGGFWFRWSIRRERRPWDMMDIMGMSRGRLSPGLGEVRARWPWRASRGKSEEERGCLGRLPW